MIVKILFFCFSLFSSPLFAVNTANTLNPVANNTSSGEKLATLPQAEKLVSGWWDYFNVPEQLLAKRIEEVQQHYPHRLQALPVIVKETADVHLHSFITNLKALQELRKPDVGNTLAKPVVQQTQYSIAEWLNLADELRKTEWEMQERQSQLANEAITLDAAQNRLDTLMLDYIAAKPIDSNKFLLGLDIMAKRSAMAVGDEQLKLNKALLEQQRTSVNNLKELSENASNKLKTDKDFLQQNEQQLQELEAKVEATQTASRKALLETLGVTDSTPLALSNSRLRHQQAINAMLEEAALALQIIKIRAEKDLTTLLLNQFSNINAFSDHLKQWQSQQKQQQQNILNWTKETSNELNQVQDAMIRLSADSGNHDDSLARSFKQRLKTAQDGLVSLKQMEADNDTLNKLMQEINNRLVAHSGKFIWFDWSSLQLLGLKTQVVALWTEPLFTIGDTPVTTAGIVRVIVIISIAALISWLFQRVMRHLTERVDEGEHGHVSVFYTVGRLAHYLILLIGIVVALSSIGLDFTNLALVAGALSVGMGFGLQSIVNNFVSGLILLFEGTIKVGDFIELDATTNGVVREINVRSTQISTSDGIDIIVPNSILASNQVINWTLREANRRIRVPFSVAYGTNKELVETAALEAASKVRFTHQPARGNAAQCWLVKFGDNGLHFELVVWINQEAIKKASMVHAAYLWEIETSLNKYQIEIPFPQRELRVRNIEDKIRFE